MPRDVRDPGGTGKARKAAAKPKASKPQNHRAAKPKKPKVVNPGTFKEATGAGAGTSSSTALGATGHPAGAGLAALELAGRGGGSLSGAGLSDVLVDLVGEGQLRLSSALTAWQREQDRVANRAWRRPGGMARMGGL